MSDHRISSSLALLLLTSPLSTTQAQETKSNAIESITSTKQNSSYRSSLRRMKEQLSQASHLTPMGTYVGQLQERWQFPSDHLPIGMTLGDTNIASWNVLDADYMSWVTEKDSQGLKRSMIVDEHVYIEGTNLTIRDKHVVDMVLGMIAHETHPRSILALQECNNQFLEELSKRLPENFAVISHHGEALLVDTTRYDITSIKEVKDVFSQTPERGFQDIILTRKDNGENLRVFNVHLPGDPLHPARYEFTQYMSATFDPSMATIAMGDMNFNELEMADAMLTAFANSDTFNLYTAYCTNISPFVFDSKAIDHFIAYNPNKATGIDINAPEEVMQGLTTFVSMLEGN